MSNIKVTNKSSSNLNLKYHQTIPRSCDKFLDILFLSGMQMKTRGYGVTDEPLGLVLLLDGKLSLLKPRLVQ